jgi:AAA domain-containing protein
VVGYAGTGKSMMLGVAREAWEADGYRVRGAALSGIAAEQLEAGSGIVRRTAHSLLFQWEQGREELTARQMERLLSPRAGCRRESGAGRGSGTVAGGRGRLAFRAIAERVGAAEITAVAGNGRAGSRRRASRRPGSRRRRWRATKRAGMVQGHATLDDAKAVRRYASMIWRASGVLLPSRIPSGDDATMFVT